MTLPTIKHRSVVILGQERKHSIFWGQKNICSGLTKKWTSQK